MDTTAIQVGTRVRALSDRVFDYAGLTSPLVIWKAGQVLEIQGVIQMEGYREFLIKTGDGTDWENVPEPLMSELFITS